MDSKTTAAVREFTLNARALLEKEVGDQLEGIYGWLPDGTLAPAETYPAIQEIDEAKAARREIERFVAENLDAGTKPVEARSELLREAAFTWLNRLVALKMMESRKLVRQTVTRGVQSSGFLLWLTEPGNEAHYAKHEQGDLPQNRLGEGPRQEAYRHYILSQCGKLGQEIRVLFDPGNLSSRFFPRPTSLQQLIQVMNASTLQEAWSPGNEETIGWVYQFFNEYEKKEVFDRLYKKKQKVRQQDVPAATQLFTPNWIVKWIVHNTLGQYWLRMHPDSRLGAKLPYLVPLAGEVPSPPVKKVRDIKLMDPACGTMHFGLEAFDLFAAMYREEMERAGSPGWPEKPSVEREEDIPPAIVSNNLHGIDIDLRSVQLSALSLWLKAKALNPKAVMTESRLACASVLRFKPESLEKLLTDLKLQHSIYSVMLKPLWEDLCRLETGGSLVRLDEHLSDAVRAARNKLDGQLPLFAGILPTQFETADGVREFWEIIENQIVQALDFYARREAEKSAPQGGFAQEMTKGFQVLDLMLRRYDVVVTNPPYMTRRNMNPSLASFVQKHYPESKGDLYAAFIERCAELLASEGRFGMITQQSFMFISSYEKMRCRLLGSTAIEAMCHVGPRAFEAISGEKVNTTLFALRKEPAAERRENAVGTYFRLVREPDGDSKRRRFEAALGALRSGREDPLVFRYRQKDFDAIPGSPWVYWITHSIRELFERLDNLGMIARPRHGMSTGNNSRFLRLWWEVGIRLICFDCSNRVTAEHVGSRWFPYMKGGGFKRWYGNQEHILNFVGAGRELLAAKDDGTAPGHRHDNPEFYFRRGVTWTDLTSGRFNARLSPGGFIFDVSGSSTFPDDIPLVLGVMNSRFAQYVLKLINPTLHVQVGDLARLPIPKRSSPVLPDLVNQAVELARAGSTEDETTYDFIAPPDWTSGIADVARRREQLSAIEAAIDEEVYRLYGIGEADRLAIERELADPPSGEELDELEPENEGGLSEADDSPCIEIAAEPAAPYQETPQPTREELARRWISYAVGIVLGRFEPGAQNGLGRGRFSPETAATLREPANPDGILVMDEGHPDDLPSRVLDALKRMVGEAEAAHLIRSASGKEGPPEDLLRQFLERAFFKLHIRQYRKRPVYWYLQAPKKRYGLWIFHERLTQDTLFSIQTQYVEPKVKHLEARIGEMRSRRDGTQGRERRRIEQTMAALSDILDDVREFHKKLEWIVRQRGYRPHIDDGILLNMAPLWELIPSWQTEPKKAWQSLERGDYDWSHQAMDHWPDRVKEKCKTNKSYSIAHGLA